MMRLSWHRSAPACQSLTECRAKDHQQLISNTGFMTDEVRNISAAFDLVTDHWQPRRLANVNDYDVKVVN